MENTPPASTLPKNFYKQNLAGWRGKVNRKRSEAVSEVAKDRPRTAKGTFEPGAVLCDTAPGKPDNRQRTKTAQAAQVSTATATRAQALVNKRPYLASEVAAGSIRLTEGLRQAQAVKRASETAQVER